MHPTKPRSEGLYDQRFEHDSCGVGFVCDIAGRPSNDVLLMGLASLCNLEHRGAKGADINTGDGAGVLTQLPDELYRAVLDFALPPAGSYATGIAFIPSSGLSSCEGPTNASVLREMEAIYRQEGLTVLGWRALPVDPSVVGSAAVMTMPSFQQVFVAGEGLRGIDLDRRVYIARKRIENEVRVQTTSEPSQDSDAAMGNTTTASESVYFPSLSSRTIVYKGMLTPPQLADFFPDLSDKRFSTALALVHSRFSTNTFPSWPLAHPYRMIGHNGEINTIGGNRNWMRAREALLESKLLPNLPATFPVCSSGSSDTAGFDEVFELLVMGGYSLAEAMLMMIPEPWEHHQHMNPTLRAFYQYNHCRMEPWDGPAAIAFTDGESIGAVLDRNGLRPLRYWVTKDDLVIMASEVGVIDVLPSEVVEKGRLKPGSMFLVDTKRGRVVEDGELKQEVASARPYQQWLDENLCHIDTLPPGVVNRIHPQNLQAQQIAFGYTHEDKKQLLAPMALKAKEAVGSMGTDTPLAVLSNRPKLLFDYFKQLFAQVTNPPLDAIREEIITSLFARVGPEGNLFDVVPESCKTIHLDSPMISNEELAKLAALDDSTRENRGFRSVTLSTLYSLDISTNGNTKVDGKQLSEAISRLQKEASNAIADGATTLILSDRGTNKSQVAIPSLLATSAVHHHLVAEKSRTQVGLVVEAGDARECHHFCLLLGYGANAINPYLALATVAEMVEEGEYGLGLESDATQAQRNYLTAANQGILKVMSKMGISTIASYVGAQIFEAIGLANELVDKYFCGTTSRLGGVGLEALAAEVKQRHALAYPSAPLARSHRSLEYGGEYQWRREGEYHLFNPQTVFKLQHATRSKRFEIFREYSELVNNQQLGTLRGLFGFKTNRTPVPLSEVEPASSIVKRFSTGAMSYGSISPEAHETLAIAMNRIGAKSNTGEGGEDSRRFTPDSNGDWRRSAIKQVASGRFGVTSEYLVNADDLQIKMAQGAKPGEGGQLPGNKVYPHIAKTRHSTPGVGLISPPPHHDIYSIEDLAQLIHDLKNSNPKARVQVKLVAEVGVGTVAAGVAKAHTDVVLISGHDGGTGASPLTSIKHAGVPWELGLAETQQTLLLNDLRDRIVVQCDGQLKTGRDVMIAALLGAEEFGFATAPLVVMGCVMMRVCHLDTCPVGIATQDAELRKNFTGQPEFVETFVEFIAEEVRELLAQLGYRTLDEAIGKVESLDVVEAVNHWKADGLDLSPLLHLPEIAREARRHQWRTQDHGLERGLDQAIIVAASPALEKKEPTRLKFPIRNVNRSVGTMLGYEVTKRFGGNGLPDNTITIDFEGSAGNSFGAFVPRGITLRLEGDANDYLGKGLSGGRLVVFPSKDAPFTAEENVIAGNVILYGATSGEVFLRGQVGERFCVRNSGAIAVVEGIGDHGCEYMTGGKVVVLGPFGRNFAAGMSGGIAYVYDAKELLWQRTNHEMVELELPSNQDLSWLKERISCHANETGSSLAKRLLGDWDSKAKHFVMVTPIEYKKAMDRVQQDESSLDAAAELAMANA